METITIRPLEEDTLKEGLALVWRVFLEFEAPDYSPEGVEEFRKFIQPDSFSHRLEHEDYRIWGCYLEEELVGVLSARPPCHISLLFVDKRHHRKGYARRLFHHMLAYYGVGGDIREVTVNSSPYAQKAYGRLGFGATGGEQTVNGLRFIPMVYRA